VLDRDIATHYELGLEQSRLFPGGLARLEYVRSVELLERLLPPPPARVLDVGGGSGLYAAALCRRGYSVQLIDPVPLHVEQAAALASSQSLTALNATLGDARRLEGVEIADAVLLMGPLYHLVDGEDRARAWREAVRVLRPGGVVVAVGISRYASLLDGLRRDLLGDPVFRPIVERDLLDGQHRNPDVTGRPEYFTTAYFHHPDELAREARHAGLRDVQLFGIEGPAALVEGVAAAADPGDTGGGAHGDRLGRLCFAARAVEQERSLIGASPHLMVAGTKPPERGGR
jgi:SAM-dependent methyltransferase